MNQGTTLESAVAFLEGLDIQAPVRGVGEQAPSYENGKNQIIVSPGSIEVMDKKLTAQQKQDIANAKLLAQLAADKKYDVSKQPMEWYQSYADVLSHIGFLNTDIKLVDATKSDTSITVQKVFLEILAASLSGEPAIIFKAAIDALGKLGEGDSSLKLFQQKFDSQHINNVHISYATIGDDGQPSVYLAVLLYNSTASSSTLLFFFNYSLTNVHLQTALSSLSLNESVYNGIRDKVSAKLGQAANDYINNIDI